MDLEFLESIKPYVQVDPSTARKNIATVRQLALTSSKAIETFAGYYIPGPEQSEALLHHISSVNEAIAWLATKVVLNDIGCWTLPLTLEYDSKGRARYPTLSNVTFGARGELAHRFVLRRVWGAELRRDEVWDHLDRNHACCNPTHGELVSHGINTVRGRIAARHVPGQEPLF